jgi:hypothetical protein
MVVGYSKTGLVRSVGRRAAGGGCGGPGTRPGAGGSGEDTAAVTHGQGDPLAGWTTRLVRPTPGLGRGPPRTGGGSLAAARSWAVRLASPPGDGGRWPVGSSWRWWPLGGVAGGRAGGLSGDQPGSGAVTGQPLTCLGASGPGRPCHQAGLALEAVRPPAPSAAATHRSAAAAALQGRRATRPGCRPTLPAAGIIVRWRGGPGRQGASKRWPARRPAVKVGWWRRVDHSRRCAGTCRSRAGSGRQAATSTGSASPARWVGGPGCRGQHGGVGGRAGRRSGRCRHCGGRHQRLRGRAAASRRWRAWRSWSAPAAPGVHPASHWPSSWSSSRRMTRTRLVRTGSGRPGWSWAATSCPAWPGRPGRPLAWSNTGRMCVRVHGRNRSSPPERKHQRRSGDNLLCRPLRS